MEGYSSRRKGGTYRAGSSAEGRADKGTKSRSRSSSELESGSSESHTPEDLGARTPLVEPARDHSHEDDDDHTQGGDDPPIERRLTPQVLVVILLAQEVLRAQRRERLPLVLLALAQAVRQTLCNQLPSCWMPKGK